jgi:hypothetical protein
LRADGTYAAPSGWAPTKVYANVKSTFQNISSSTAVVINFATEVSDSNSLHDNVTNNSRLTIPTGGTGFYNIALSSYITLTNAGINANTWGLLGIRKNGSTVIKSARIQPSGDNTNAIYYFPTTFTEFW